MRLKAIARGPEALTRTASITSFKTARSANFLIDPVEHRRQERQVSHAQP
jgi:hypothetical protein